MDRLRRGIQLECPVTTILIYLLVLLIPAKWDTKASGYQMSGFSPPSELGMGVVRKKGRGGGRKDVSLNCLHHIARHKTWEVGRGREKKE